MNNFAEWAVFVTLYSSQDNKEFTVVYYAADSDRAHALATTLRHNGKMCSINKQGVFEEVPIRFVGVGHL